MRTRYKPQSSYKPRECPGCKVMQPMAEHTICRECKENLEAFHRFKPQIDQLAARETYPILIGERHAVPRGARYISSTEFRDDDHDNGTPAAVMFGMAFKRLLTAICPSYPAPAKKLEHPSTMFGSTDDVGRILNWRKDGHGMKSGTVVELTGDGRDRIRDVFVAINLLLREAEQDGRTKGQNLLQQLAAGEVGVGCFDKHLEDIARVQREAQETATRRMGQMDDPRPKR